MQSMLVMSLFLREPRALSYNADLTVMTPKRLWYTGCTNSNFHCKIVKVVFIRHRGPLLLKGAAKTKTKLNLLDMNRNDTGLQTM